MKKRMKKKITSVIMATLTLGLLSSNVVPVMATDAVKGIQVNVDHSELDAAAKNAKDAGVDITKVADMDKGTADSLDQLPSIKAEIERDYRNQIKTLNEARIQLEDYHQQKATYDNLKRQYDADLAEYLQKKADYDAAMVQYEKDMAELERLKDTDGYLSKPAPQSLTFLSEPNAVIDVQGKVYSSAEWIATLKSMGYTSGAVGVARGGGVLGTGGDAGRGGHREHRAEGPSGKHRGSIRSRCVRPW